MWMNPNKYTFLFDRLTDLIIQTPTQSSETTGPIRDTMTVHSWCDPSPPFCPLPTRRYYRTKITTAAAAAASDCTSKARLPSLPLITTPPPKPAPPFFQCSGCCSVSHVKVRPRVKSGCRDGPQVPQTEVTHRCLKHIVLFFLCLLGVV